MKNGSTTSIIYFNVGPFIKNGNPIKVLYSSGSDFSDRLGEYFDAELGGTFVHRFEGLDIFYLFVKLKRTPDVVREEFLAKM